MPVIIEEQHNEYSCPFNQFKPCLGAACMAFSWSGRPTEQCTTDNLVETAEGLRPSGLPKAPEGEGWVADGAPFSRGYHRSDKDKLPKATAQHWIRRRARLSGACGRIEVNRGYYDCDDGIPF